VSLQELLSDLRTRGITLSVDGDHLRCNAPKGSLTKELQQQLVSCKLDIVHLLRENGSAAEPIPKADRSQPLPLSFAQQRMWFLHRLQPDNPAYNITAFKRIAAEVDPRALEAAVRQIAHRHECLRTTFEEHEGTPSQVIHRDCEITVSVADLAVPAEEERENQLKALLRHQTRLPFDLSTGPLLRISLARMAPGEHVLVLTMHHIISDGWSLGILFGELGEIYNGIRSANKPALHELPLQYADYASWQRKSLSAEALEQDLAYWEQKLKALPGILDLPADFPRPAIQGSNGAVFRFALPSQVAAGLRRLSQQEGASLFMVLLTVFKALLNRYTRQSDIAVGTPVHTRNRAEFEKLIGCFINTLVLRTQLSAGMSARELLGHVRETVLEGHAHLNVPFEKLVDVLQPERSLAHSALFQVTFNVQNTPLSLEYETLSVSSMFDLSLFMWENAETICGAFEYSTDLFKESTIGRMAEHLGVLAAAIAENPDQPIALLPLLSQAEKAELLDLYNRTESAYPRDQTVPELISLQAQRTPEAIAVIVPAGERGARQITYRGLDLQSNHLAHRLRSFGIGRHSLVGVCLDRSIDMVVALIGVLKAGAAYVPMDPHLPKDRLTFMIEDAKLSLILSEEKFQHLVPAGVNAFFLDRDADQLQESSNLPPENTASPEDAMYVIYTSGSTGRPKGVQIMHRSVVNLLESVRHEPGLTADDRLLSVTTLSFDIAALEIYLPLITGACVLLVGRAVAADGRALAQLMEASNATVMQATPVTWRMLLEAGWNGKRSLRMWCGGEALPRELAARLLSTGSELWNLYGPTETTIWSTVHRVTDNESPIPIGKPIANTQIYLLDDHRQLVPKGVSGELCIGGDGLACGYLNRPELSAEKFIPHPFIPGARLYRTGDLARWSSNGNLEFLGRLDHQVKIRGLRIELEEIEHVLRQHSTVQDVVVTTTSADSGKIALAAYIVPRKGVELSSFQGEFRSYLASRIPEYMVPSTFTALETLPLTANGKVDRKALPAPVRKVERAVAPRNFVETQLLTIWQQVLQLHGIGIRDNFFNLGGNSLTAMKLLAQMEKVFGRLPVSWLFEAPTVEQMAAKLTDAGIKRSWRSLVAIQPHGEKPPLFLVPGGIGNPLTSTNFALSLPPDQPVYGLQFVGLDGSRPPLKTVEEIASHFVSEIQSIQREGPYHVGGHCLGGVIAFEMAQQLTAKGHEVAVVTMIDSFPPSVYRPPLPYTIRLRQVSIVVQKLGRFCRFSTAEKMARLRQKIRDGRTLGDQLSSERHLNKLDQLMWEANTNAIRNYQPKPYKGKVVLILCDGGTLRDTDPRLEWVALSGADPEIHRLDVPDHNLLVEHPWVSMLAADLQRTLADVNSMATALRNE